MEPRRCLNSRGPQGPTHTHQSPTPPSVVCFALISVWMRPSMCVWVSLCLCVLCGSFIVMAARGQRRCWRKSKHTSLGQYWLFLSFSLSTSFPLFLLICVTVEPKYIRNRCNVQVLCCARFSCFRSKKGSEGMIRKCLHLFLQRKISWQSLKINDTWKR